MDDRRRQERDSAASPKPPLSTPHLLCDVSNLKTPRPYTKNPNPNPNLTSPSSLFFTASKKTPYSSFSTPTSSKSHSTVRAPVSRSKAAHRLKALEIEQSRTARKAHVRREKTLESFARSLTAWLNLLLQNPEDCGCNVGACSVDEQNLCSSSKGKRRSLDGVTIDTCGKWRSVKRHRGTTNAGVDMDLSSMKPALSFLEKSLCDVCSLEDMMERMLTHMSRECCNEVLLILAQVCKNIDEGRLKMKLHCPLVTDLAIREKAIKILLCYNPLWLRIGLHILFGGDSLLISHGDQDRHFLKEIIEKHFLTHVGIARKYALNKLVGGIYRPGYYEALGNVILKRFLLLAIALDKAKCESSLPIKHGIDSIDGVSPLLFTCDSPIKSSRHVIQEFLTDSMHGEGDLLAHLVILGCKVNYQQSLLCEYDFKVKNIFEDFRDGILLCRVVQLLLRNELVLSKVKSPSDTPKKNLQNCSTALQHLKDAGVQMSDSDGIMVTAADLANGDKELTCSVLWNVFVHLQIPLLVNRTSLLKEIEKVKGSDTELLMCNAINEMDLLLHWIKAVCVTQNMKIDSFSCLIHGKTLSCLNKYYFGNDIHHSFLEKENDDGCNDDMSRRFACQSHALLDIAYFQNATSMFGNSPKVLHPCDILDEDACIDERSTIILLVFHASRLLTMDKLDMTDKPRFPSKVPRYPRPSGNDVQELFYPHNKEGHERSAIFIQAQLRGFIKRSSFLKMKSSVILLQSVVKAWLAFRFRSCLEYGTLTRSSPCSTNGIYERYLTFMIDRQRFLGTRKAVILIQQFVRACIQRKYNNVKFRKSKFNVLEIHGAGWKSRNREGTEALDLQRCAASNIQKAWKDFMYSMQLKRSFSAVKIQAQWRCWAIRKDYLCQVKAIKIIQSVFRRMTYRKAFHRKNIAAIEMQKFIRGHLVRNKLLGASKIRSNIGFQRSVDSINDNFMNNFELKILIGSVIKLQRWWKQILFCRFRTHATILIQSFTRGWIVRRIAAKRKQSIFAIQAFIRRCIARRTITQKKLCILKIQRCWRNILYIKKRKTSVLIIQACIRGWNARQKIAQIKHDIVIIQSCWKGYLVRKHSRPQLLDLRHRMELSAANVNDEMRLINRLVVAISELLGYRSISNIRQTCAILDTATELSQKCCETLVAAGAINILLKQIQLLNRGIPDQEVLKHVLSTLRNIARYNHLSHVLINTPQSMEIIFQEMLRNKNEGFLISCELLKRLCSNTEGLETARKLQGHIKRLNNLIVGLDRKVKFGRYVQPNNRRDPTATRLREAISLMSLLITEDRF